MNNLTTKEEPCGGTFVVPPISKLDIEIYDTQNSKWAQAKYLVHGYDDVLWTDDLSLAIMFLAENLRKVANEPKKDMEGFCADCGERCDYC